MRGSRAPAALLAAGVLAGLMASACTPGPTGTPRSTPEVTPTPVAGSSEAPTSGPPSQTDTAFGRIWDAIPKSFPLPTGAVPAIIGPNPASAVVQFPSTTGNESQVARLFFEAFDREGMVVALEGPREDGAFVVTTGTQTDPCHIQVSVAPLGAFTVATILYGAGCPFE